MTTTNQPAERRLAVDGGKYTFILHSPGDYRVHVLRHGEPWLVIEQGTNAIYSLVAEMLDAGTLVAAVRRWATAGDGYLQHEELHQAFRAYCDEHGEKKPPRLEADRSIEGALTSSAQFLESLLAEGVPGHRIRPEAALEGVQRAISNLGSEHAVVTAAKEYITAPSGPQYDSEGAIHDPARDAYDRLCAAVEAHDGTRPREPEVSGWRTDAPPRGVRCLVTARGLAGDIGVLVASASPDHEGVAWFCNGTRLVEVLAWMPMPEPAEVKP